MKKNRIATLVAGALLLLSPMAAFAGQVKLVEGTEVELNFLETLSSGSAVEGQRFNLELTGDLVIDGVVVAPRGAKAVGTVTHVKKRGRMGKAGELDVLLDYVLVGEQRVKLRASSGKEGEGRVGSTVALTVLFGPIGLLKRGKDVTINAGTPITAFIDATTVVEVVDAVAAPAVVAAPAADVAAPVEAAAPVAPVEATAPAAPIEAAAPAAPADVPAN
jgi:hypothetical protein